MIGQLQKVADPFLILPAYLPKWQTTARQMGLEKLSFWSPFDALQKVKKTGRKPLQLNDLTWPEDAQFIRMFDRVVVLSKMTHYANVFFAYPMADQLDRVDLLEKGKLKQQLTIDDRGFVSRILDYDQGRLVKLSYLSEGGAVVAEQDYQSGHVRALLPDGQINEYDQMADLLVQLTTAYLAVQEPAAALVADSTLNRKIAEQVAFDRLLWWTGQTPEMGVSPDWQGLSKSVTRLQSQQAPAQAETDEVAAEKRSQASELIAPYAVTKSTLLQKKQETILYCQIGDVGQGEQAKLIKQALDFVLKKADRTVVFEGELAPMVLPAMLDDALKALDEQKTEGEVAALKAHFVFLGKQAPAGRLAYLATASLYLDLSRQPDLSVLAETVGLGLPALTKVQTAYSLLPAYQQSIEELASSLEDYLIGEDWQESHEALLKKGQELGEQALQGAWQSRLKA
nr:accessory Sec system glycosyltransferase Asp1 [Fructobacillus papyrifericola]